MVTMKLIQTIRRFTTIATPQLHHHVNNGVRKTNQIASNNMMVQLRSSSSLDSSSSTESSWQKMFSWLSEMKTFIAITIGIVSWWSESSINRNQTKKQLELTGVTEQIRDLYGPLYGNRLVRNTSYKAALGGHKSVKTYLMEAEEKKDAGMIRRWRSYVSSVLQPLDKKAENLILTNAHLIVANNNEFPEEFVHFLENFAHSNFVMQSWRDEEGNLESCGDMTDDDFRMENNATSGYDHDERILQYVTDKYAKLRKRQDKLSLDQGEGEKKRLSEYLLAPFCKD